MKPISYLKLQDISTPSLRGDIQGRLMNRNPFSLLADKLNLLNYNISAISKYNGNRNPKS